MSGPSKIREFPDISNKLSAPSKKPLFERQKAEAEAKRQRDEAETAAVYKDFIKSFDDEEEDAFPKPRNNDGPGRGFGQAGTRGTFGGASKRHFTPANLKSGPGSLGPTISSTFKTRGAHTRFSNKAQVGSGRDDTGGATDAKSAFQQADDEENDRMSPEDRAAPKPTIFLSSLVPGTSPSSIKAMLPKNLQVEGVRMLAPSNGANSTGKRSSSAIVTLAKDTPASDIDAAVNTLQNKYLGLGFKLSISRHLSSAVVESLSNNVISSATATQPFGAVPVQLPPASGIGFGRGHPSHRGGFAPPTSYTPQSQFRGANTAGPLQVVVKPPSDLKELKLIHKTLEAVLTHGPEFEALLMSRSDVQKEVKWIWLWDARSQGGIWYRWRLWEMLSGSKSKSVAGPGPGSKMPYSLLFDTGAPWQSPDMNLKFEFTTDFESFVTDPDYDSSDEEEDGEVTIQRIGPSNLAIEAATAEYLNPLQKAKLTHLLSRLPSTTARLRKGDVARVTAFAITHAGRGSEEVVNMLLDNTEHPFVYQASNPAKQLDEAKQKPSPHGSDESADEGNTQTGPDKEDLSASMLIALYLISDLLSSSSTSGVRNAWRYRQLFESALASRNTFTHLGNMERELKWGRLRAEKWRRAVTQLLQMWEGWCVFGSAAHEEFVKAFDTACEGNKKTVKLKSDIDPVAEGKTKKKGGAWKAVDEKAAEAAEPLNDVDEEMNDQEEDVDGEPMEDDDDDIDGDIMKEDDDLDGQAMITDAPTLARQDDSTAEEIITDKPGSSRPIDVPLPKSTAKRKRPTAADMFAAESDAE